MKTGDRILFKVKGFMGSDFIKSGAVKEFSPSNKYVCISHQVDGRGSISEFLDWYQVDKVDVLEVMPKT